MGYPLKDIPTTSLLFSIFQLFVSQEKLQKTIVNEFYHKDVVRFLKHQSVYKLLSDKNSTLVDNFTKEIGKENLIFINKAQIESILIDTTASVKSGISAIFNSYTTINEFLDRILNLIALLKEDVTTLEKEYL